MLLGRVLKVGLDHNYLNWKNVIIFFRVITIVAFFIAIIWLYSSPKFDSAFAAAGALAAVIALFVIPKNKKKQSNQSQRVKGGSTGIQAGGDVNIKLPK